jgi:glycosyltransferase involved in cell wall biosynthesis
VRFAGGIRDRCDLARLLAAADVFVTASLMETYGLILVEAMACGTPVIAFRVGGIPEAAPDGEGAILCALGDRAAFTEAIMKLRNSEQLRERLGAAGRETVLLRNQLSFFSSLFAEIYRESISSRDNIERQQSAIIV